MKTRVFHGVVSPWAKKILREAGEGEIALVTSRGIYLAAAGERILLCDAAWGAVPAGIALKDFPSFASLFPEAGIPFSLKEGLFVCGGVKAEADWIEAAPDDSVLTPDPQAFQKALSVLKQSAKNTSFAVLGSVLWENAPCETLLLRRAYDALKELLDSMKEKNARGIKRAAEKLIGLGPGLTPSGDDVLAGLYYGLSHSPLRESAECITLKEALFAAGEKTAPVSASLLKAVASGAPFALLSGAWRDPEKANDLVKAGAHSGSEMLLGLLCAAALLTEKNVTPV